MVERRRKSQLPERVQDDLIRQFVSGATARTAADLVGVNRHTATLYFHKLRELIALKLTETEPWLSGEIEVHESYFVGSRKGKHGRSAAGKVPATG
jgi:transposase